MGWEEPNRGLRRVEGCLVLRGASGKSFLQFSQGKHAIGNSASALANLSAQPT